jgi:uncharacterized protein
VEVSPEVAGRRVVVIDEIADTGETLRLAGQRFRELGAQEVITTALVSHSWSSSPPDLSGLISDALVIFPWDERVLVNRQWLLHPEPVDALKRQG